MTDEQGGWRTPWPHLTEKAAARRMGVDPQRLRGAAGNSDGRLRFVRRQGKTGQDVYLYCAEDVDRFARICRPGHDFDADDEARREGARRRAAARHARDGGLDRDTTSN